MKMWLLGAGLLACTWSGVALGQTAQFKCPKPGTVVQYEDGSVTEWISQEANFCRTNSKPKNADARLLNWYAPMATVPVNGSLSWLDQVKPQTIWPISVGKKVSARYDGAALVGSYSGSWIFTYNVEKYERITTKAGTFDAFLITRTQDRLDSSFKEKWSQWYAPEPGISVRYEYWNNQGRTNKGDAVSVK